MVSNMTLRILSALVLGALSILAIFSGGSVFRLFAFMCSAIMIAEWCSINDHKLTKMLLLGLCYILVPMTFWVYESREYPTEFARNIMWIFSVVWSCDIFAFFGGRVMKGSKLAPSISPNKTWSGAIIGACFSFIISYVYISRFMNNDERLVYWSVPMIVASILGDLLESKVKRKLNVKDTGNIIPGHGGLCDRLDSFLLVTYVFILIRLISFVKV